MNPYLATPAAVAILIVSLLHVGLTAMVRVHRRWQMHLARPWAEVALLVVLVVVFTVYFAADHFDCDRQDANLIPFILLCADAAALMIQSLPDPNLDPPVVYDEVRADSTG